MLVFLNS